MPTSNDDNQKDQTKLTPSGLSEYPEGAIQTIEQLCALPAGTVLFMVHKLPECGSVGKFILVKPAEIRQSKYGNEILNIAYFDTDHTSEWCHDIKPLYTDALTESWNIDKFNNYNKHAIFTDEKKAQAWADAEIFTDADKERRKLELDDLIEMSEYIDDDWNE